MAIVYSLINAMFLTLFMHFIKNAQIESQVPLVYIYFNVSSVEGNIYAFENKHHALTNSNILLK